MYVEMVGCYTRTPAAGRGSLSPAGAEEEERHAEAAEEKSSTLKTLVQKGNKKYAICENIPSSIFLE